MCYLKSKRIFIYRFERWPLPLRLLTVWAEQNEEPENWLTKLLNGSVKLLLSLSPEILLVGEVILHSWHDRQPDNIKYIWNKFYKRRKRKKTTTTWSCQCGSLIFSYLLHDIVPRVSIITQEFVYISNCFFLRIYQLLLLYIISTLTLKK